MPTTRWRCGGWNRSHPPRSPYIPPLSLGKEYSPWRGHRGVQMARHWVTGDQAVATVLRHSTATGRIHEVLTSTAEEVLQQPGTPTVGPRTVQRCCMGLRSQRLGPKVGLQESEHQAVRTLLLRHSKSAERSPNQCCGWLCTAAAVTACAYVQLGGSWVCCRLTRSSLTWTIGRTVVRKVTLRGADLDGHPHAAGGPRPLARRYIQAGRDLCWRRGSLSTCGAGMRLEPRLRHFLLLAQTK
jgi:hypothetical protein